MFRTNKTKLTENMYCTAKRKTKTDMQEKINKVYKF